MKMLFIGGQQDGKWHEVDFPANALALAGAELYKSKRLTIGIDHIDVMVREFISNEDTLKNLLERYRE